MNRLALVVILALASAPASVSGQERLATPGCRLSQAPDLGLKAPTAYPQPLKYGSKAWQTIQFYPAKDATSAPLVIAFVDTADEWARYRFNEAGISLAVVPNRETAPKARKTIDNYVAAIAYLYDQAERLGIDRARLALYGRGNDGSMAVLLGTDPALLARARVPFDAVRGVISIGGEDFDVARRMQTNSFLRSLYRRYYSSDETEAVALSPMSHLEAPNAPAFLLLADERDNDGVDESRSFSEALVKAGTHAEFMTLPEQVGEVRRTHFLVQEGGSGWEIMDFLRTAFAKTPGALGLR